MAPLSKKQGFGWSAFPCLLLRPETERLYRNKKPTTHLAVAFCVVGFLSFHFSYFVFEILQFIGGTIGISPIQFAAYIGVEAI